MVKLTRKAQQLPISGEGLVADFHAALVGLVTTDLVVAEATHSELSVEDALRYNNPSNGIYITSNDISPEQVELLSKQSIDAHLKKIQAEQIQMFANSKISQQQEALSSAYKGKKVVITKISNNDDVFIPLWDDPQTGGLREGTYNGSTLKGTIEQLSIEKNILLIRPTLVWRKIQPTRRFFLVTVVNIETMTPNIFIRLR